MLTNRGEWVFKDVDVRKLIALVAVELGEQGPEGCSYVIRPEHHREVQYKARRLDGFIERSSSWLRSYSSGLVQPTLPTADPKTSIDVLETLMSSPRLAAHSQLKVGRVYADVETSRKYKAYYKVTGTESDLWPVYGGDSFDIWQPDTGQYYAQTLGSLIFKLVQEKRAKARRGTPYFETAINWRKEAKTHPCLHPRIAYRDITNRTNTRTLIASLIPPERVLTQSAPWVLWIDLKHPAADEAFLLGVMSSLPADWWARRFVEGHVDEEAFDALPIPIADPAGIHGRRVVELAGRLAASDDRFAGWATAVGVSYGPLKPEKRQAMLEELDAVVARLYGLNADQLIHIFTTFHEWPEEAQAGAWAARCDRTLAILRDLP
jgi:hypothetical protein